MAVDLVAVVTTAIAAAKRAGVTAAATITKPASAPNPLTGVASGSPVVQVMDVVIITPASLARRNQSFAEASIAVFASASAFTVDPEPGHTLQVGGKTYRVSVTERYAPSGIAIGFYVGANA